MSTPLGKRLGRAENGGNVSAVHGNQQSRDTVTCPDGSTGTIELAFTDWTVVQGTGKARASPT
ncbi:hypothetical protein ACFYSF_09590 [Streptomyces canus]|uniref:hypothetical protein n=1 Tax=Streptomyces canus TaxID=58343 RepID=UPI00367BF720